MQLQYTRQKRYLEDDNQHILSDTFIKCLQEKREEQLENAKTMMIKNKRNFSKEFSVDEWDNPERRKKIGRYKK